VSKNLRTRLALQVYRAKRLVIGKAIVTKGDVFSTAP